LIVLSPLAEIALPSSVEQTNSHVLNELAYGTCPTSPRNSSRSPLASVTMMRSDCSGAESARD
jgi:hypothetical protein